MSDDLYAGFTGKTCPIDPMRRTTCQKCGCKTHDDPAMNMSRMAWCDTCRYLLREPDYPYPRYSNVMPSESTMRALGLYVTFDERQMLERIPNDNQVELWPELQTDKPQPAPLTLDELFGRRA